MRMPSKKTVENIRKQCPKDCRVLPAVVTICYGKREEWPTRKQAEMEFLEAVMGTEGSERERYMTVYARLKIGCKVCSDDEDGHDE